MGSKIIEDIRCDRCRYTAIGAAVILVIILWAVVIVWGMVAGKRVRLVIEPLDESSHVAYEPATVVAESDDESLVIEELCIDTAASGATRVLNERENKEPTYERGALTVVSLIVLCGFAVMVWLAGLKL